MLIENIQNDEKTESARIIVFLQFSKISIQSIILLSFTQLVAFHSQIPTKTFIQKCRIDSNDFHNIC